MAKAVTIGAVPPIMLKTAVNPGGLPMEVFDGFRKALAANRAQFFLEVASGPLAVATAECTPPVYQLLVLLLVSVD